MEEQKYGAYIQKRDGSTKEFKVVHEDTEFADTVKEWIQSRSQENEVHAAQTPGTNL